MAASPDKTFAALADKSLACLIMSSAALAATSSPMEIALLSASSANSFCNDAANWSACALDARTASCALRPPVLPAVNAARCAAVLPIPPGPVAQVIGSRKTSAPKPSIWSAYAPINGILPTFLNKSPPVTPLSALNWFTQSLPLNPRPPRASPVS